MPELLQEAAHTARLDGGVAPSVPRDLRAARAEMRRQIAQLERELAEVFATAFPRRELEWEVPAAGGPRVLGLGELERVRDRLAARLADARAELARRVDAEEASRALVERMIADPGEYRWVRVSNEDVGERGCKHWHSRPRWGIIGAFLGWWRVKLSSGCPLSMGRRPAAPAPTGAEVGLEVVQEAPQAAARTATSSRRCGPVRGRGGERRAEGAARAAATR